MPVLVMVPNKHSKIAAWKDDDPVEFLQKEAGVCLRTLESYMKPDFLVLTYIKDKYFLAYWVVRDRAHTD